MKEKFARTSVPRPDRKAGETEKLIRRLTSLRPRFQTAGFRASQTQAQKGGDSLSARKNNGHRKFVVTSRVWLIQVVPTTGLYSLPAAPRDPRIGCGSVVPHDFGRRRKIVHLGSPAAIISTPLVIGGSARSLIYGMLCAVQALYVVTRLAWKWIGWAF